MTQSGPDRFETGVVKSWLEKKGYGFIKRDSGERDAFVHHTGIVAGGFRNLTPGRRVQFEVMQGDKGPVAVNVLEILDQSSFSRFLTRFAQEIDHLESEVDRGNTRWILRQLNVCNSFVSQLHDYAERYNDDLSEYDRCMFEELEADLEAISAEIEKQAAKRRSSKWQKIVGVAVKVISIVADVIALVSPEAGGIIRSLLGLVQRLLGVSEHPLLPPPKK